MTDSRLQELQRLRAENELLKEENRKLAQKLATSEETIRRAKDISPVERPSAKRVARLAANACMLVERHRSCWVLRLGLLKRQFKKLKALWELLIKENFYLTEIFPPGPPVDAKPQLPKRYPSLALKQ